MPGADPGFFKTGGGDFFQIESVTGSNFYPALRNCQCRSAFKWEIFVKRVENHSFFSTVPLLQRSMLWQLLFLEWKTGTFNSIILESKFHSKRVTQIDFHSRKTFKRVKLTPQWKFHSSTSRLQSQEKVDWKGVLRNGAKWSGSELPKWEWNKC